MAGKDLTKLLPLIEKISFIKWDYKKASVSFQQAIELASKLETVNTNGVDVMTTVQENEELNVRDDEVKNYSKNEVMKNAYKVVEDYFVSPLDQSFVQTSSSDNVPKDESL